MLEDLKKEVCRANIALYELGLAIFTWGNVSGIDRNRGLVVIKPSGVAYDALTPDDMAVVDLDGKIIQGKLKPSSDTLTHLVLYDGLPEIGGVAHTHSTFATGCAQAGAVITPLGTTHADHFYGGVPVTEELGGEEIKDGYEFNTGRRIIEALKKTGRSATEMPGALAISHGPFAWGKNASDAVRNAAALEEVARMFVITKLLNPAARDIPNGLLNKHFFRKHGDEATYGQK